MIRDRCEMSRRSMPERAKICVIWDRRPLGCDTLEIKHLHLCGTHANEQANGYSRGDKWTERTLAECEANQ